MSFNTVGEENGETLVNNGTKRPKYSRYGRNNHTVDKCTAKYRNDGTMFHNLGEIEEMKYEINNEVSTQMTTKNGDLCCHGDAVMFIQPDISSLMDRSNTPFKAVGIPKMWNLLDSQSTFDVFCNDEPLTQIHKTIITLRIRCNAGIKTTNIRGHLSGYGWV